MKQILRNTARILVILLAALLSGCSLPQLTLNPQELYALPTLPEKYTELDMQLSAILETGAEYAAPVSGTNIQPVQLVDLDGDGREEAVAFFRNPEEEKSLKIYIFTAEEDTYRQTELIEGSGTAVYSVAYNDLDGDGRLELQVGWKASAELQVLEIYAIHPGGASLLVRSDYVRYTTADLDLDQRQELVVIRADQEGEGVADYYSWQEDGGLAAKSSARISVTMAELSQQGKVSYGALKDGAPALFVTGVTETPRAITDILTVRNGELSNIALSETTGVSAVIEPYCGLYPTDIDGDGLTEVPAPVQLSSLTDEGAYFQRVDWYRYDNSRKAEAVMQTYYNMEDGWYLELPPDWLNRIWVSRVSQTEESSAVFYILGSDAGEMQPFLRITAITGPNREHRAVRGNRFLLIRQSDTIYAAELLEAGDTWEYGITPDQVREAFNLVAVEWSAGDY